MFETPKAMARWHCDGAVTPPIEEVTSAHDCTSFGSEVRIQWSLINVQSLESVAFSFNWHPVATGWRAGAPW
jgi:hypothetical protein